MHRWFAFPAIAGIAAMLAACGGDDAPAPQPQQPAATPEASAPATGAVPADLPPGVTAEMVSEGQRLYSGICAACHGQNGVGGPLGPALNDQDWIHISGSYDEIVNITTTGVPQPQRYPGMMPPMGGGSFTTDQVRSISAYVYTLSHGS
jgi:mono/diheme cytochrome c family protein